MSQSTSGFTLIELLIAAAILASISLVSVQLLWDTVTTRSKQYSIEESSENFRAFLSGLTKSIKEAKAISIPSTSEIKIRGQPCHTVRYNLETKSIEQAFDSSVNCAPPDSGFVLATPKNVTIEKFEVTPTGELPPTVTVEIEGTYDDSLGKHPISFKTTVTSRITL